MTRIGVAFTALVVAATANAEAITEVRPLVCLVEEEPVAIGIIRRNEQVSVLIDGEEISAVQSGDAVLVIIEGEVIQLFDGSFSALTRTGEQFSGKCLDASEAFDALSEVYAPPSEKQKIAQLSDRVRYLEGVLDQSKEELTIERNDLRERLASTLAVMLSNELKLDDYVEQNLLAKKRVEAMSRQVAALRGQLGQLRALLDDAKVRDEAKDIELAALGNELQETLLQLADAESKLETAQKSFALD